MPDPPERRGSGSGPAAIHPGVLVLIGVLAVGLAVLGWVLAPGWVSPPIAPDSPLAQVVADEASRRAAVSATRGALVTGLLGVGALLALWINNATARAALTNARAALTNAEVAVSNSRVAVETLRVAERGHLTDRYTKAIDQLGARDNDAIRLGGIYALGQYAEDSGRPGDQRTVVQVLSAFIRRELDGVGGSDGTHEPTGADVLAAISVLARLPRYEGVVRADFPGALFNSVDISGARLAGGNLSGVRMDTVGVRCADLSNINLDGANFDNASLNRCDLTGVKGCPCASGPPETGVAARGGATGIPANGAAPDDSVGSGKSNVARARSRLARTSSRPSRSVRFATRFTRSTGGSVPVNSPVSTLWICRSTK